ncbi:MAG: hypothetical protein AABY22_27800 [Nanoarchaeota archaeon]
MKKEIHQIHGKVETFQPTTLDQIWGDTGLGKYGTLDEEKYISKLNDMNKADLQKHAVGVGIIPTDGREGLIKKLLKEFRAHVASFRKPILKEPTKVSKNALKILSEGR